MKAVQHLRLGDCVTLVSGGTPSKARDDYWGGDIPWVSCKDMKVDHIRDAEDHLTLLGTQNGTRVVPENTILIVVRGMILAREFPIAMTKRAVAFNQDLKAVKPADFVDNEYLFHWFRANANDIVGRADEAGHGTKRVQTDRLLSMPIAIPSLPEQRRIAGVLSAYDDLIDNSQRRIQILEEMARSLYREWFVEFRFPGHATRQRVNSRPEDIPSGWAVRKLGEILELQYGKALKQEDRTEGLVPVYGSSGIVGMHDTALVNGPGIVVGRKGNVGSVFWSDESFYPIDTVYFVVSKLPLRFLYHDLQSKTFLNSDAAVPGLNRTQAYSMETVVPTPELLSRFTAIADSIGKQASLLQAQCGKLRVMRDLLLPRLMKA
jgi:type I restriction enzyme S subunit